MDTLLTILKIALAIGCGVGLYYVIAYGYVFWNMAEALCKIIEFAISFIATPIKKLWEAIKNILPISSFTLKQDAIGRFADRHPTLGTGRSIKFFILAFIYLAIAFTIKILNGSFGEYLEEFIDMFPIIFVVRSFTRSNFFSLVGIISTGISALLVGSFFNFCLENYERKGYFLRWLVSIPYYIITTLLGCYFGLVLSNVWEWTANTGIGLFNTFVNVIKSDNQTFLEIMLVICCFAALVLLIYLGIILLLAAIREFVEVFFYGLIGILILLIFVIISLIFGGQAFLSTPTFTTIGIILLLFSMFGIDFIRVNKGELLGTDKF